MVVNGCGNLAFQDLTISGNDFAIQWWNGGSSTYSNVEVTAAGFGWWDYSVFGGQSVHYWFGSKIESTGTSHVENSGIFAYGGEHWFYGGEITLQAADNATNGRSGAVVLPTTGGQTADVRLFGTAVRAFAVDGA